MTTFITGNLPSADELTNFLLGATTTASKQSTGQSMNEDNFPSFISLNELAR